MADIHELLSTLQEAVEVAKAKQAQRDEAAKAFGEADEAFKEANAAVESLRVDLNATLGELLPSNPRVTVR